MIEAIDSEAKWRKPLKTRCINISGLAGLKIMMHQLIK